MPYDFDARIKYEPPVYTTEHTNLDYSINSLEDVTLTSTSQYTLDSGAPGDTLTLDGDPSCATLVSAEIKAYGEDVFTPVELKYDPESKSYSLESPPEKFELRVTTQLNPSTNKSGEGLYVGDPDAGVLSTQGESQGFRRQTICLDRPDVRSTFNVRITADKEQFPTLISNGNLVDYGDDPEGARRHFVVYDDPIAKPTYLMALVAGDLAELSKTYTDSTGHQVRVSAFATADKIAETQFALEVCCHSMKYYEDTFGIRYKHKELRLAAVSQFNAGAMENTGLVIFNDSCMYTDPHKSSDGVYDWVRHVVAHEYAHYWLGNMVGIKGWPYLFLKEGGATYMEEHYSDATGLTSAVEARIDSVRGLMGRQFAEDASPLAHALVFADSKYPDNYYTATTYSKGKEILKTIENYIGEEKFREGLRLYFSENDGKAVGLEVFLDCMTRASGIELREQFANWYVQAGTPEVTMEYSFDVETKKLKVTASQNCPLTAKESKEEGFEKQPFLIPMSIAMFNKDTGEQVMFSPDGEPDRNEMLLELSEGTQTWEFVVASDVAPVLSANRNFTSPIRLKDGLSEADRVFLAGHDTDILNRWICTNTLKRQALMSFYQAEDPTVHAINPGLIEDLNLTLSNEAISDGVKARMLSTLTLGEFLQELKHEFGSVDFDKAVAAYRAFRVQLCEGIGDSCLSIVTATTIRDIDVLVSRTGEIEPGITSKRELLGVALGVLAHSPHAEWQREVARNADSMLDADNMTLVKTSLSILSSLNSRVPGYNPEFMDRMQRYKDKHASKDHLLNNSWLSFMVSDSADGAIDRIRHLILESGEVDLGKQNHLYSAVRAFFGNLTVFNQADGAGYSLLTDILIRVNAENSHMAAILTRGLSNWQVLDLARQKLLLFHNIRLLFTEGIHDKVKEVVEMTLNSAPSMLVFEQMQKLDHEKAIAFLEKQIANATSVEKQSALLDSYEGLADLDIDASVRERALEAISKVRTEVSRVVVSSVEDAHKAITAVKLGAANIGVVVSPDVHADEEELDRVVADNDADAISKAQLKV